MIESHDQGPVLRASEHMVQTDFPAAIAHNSLMSRSTRGSDSNYPALERMSTYLRECVRWAPVLRPSSPSATTTSSPASRSALTYLESVPESVTSTSISATGPT